MDNLNNVQQENVQTDGQSNTVESSTIQTPKKEKNNVWLKVLAIVLVILVLGLTFYIVYDKVLNKDKIATDNKEDIVDEELVAFVNILNNANQKFEANYKGLTIKYIGYNEYKNEEFGGIKIYYNNKEILFFNASFLYPEINKKAVYYKEDDEIFFMTLRQWGAHHPILLVIDKFGNVLLNEEWIEGSIKIDSSKWEVTVDYFDSCCGGSTEDIVKSENKKKEDIANGTIVYKYENYKMNVLKHDYETYGEKYPESFK